MYNIHQRNVVTSKVIELFTPLNYLMRWSQVVLFMLLASPMHHILVDFLSDEYRSNCTLKSLKEGFYRHAPFDMYSASNFIHLLPIHCL